MYLECKTKRFFAIACLGKKLVFHTEICDLFKSLILIYSIFHWVKELFKSNQTRYGESHRYLECKPKIFFAIACLGKKLAFRTEICEFRDWRILTIVIFDRVIELSKLRQTWYGVSQVYIKSRGKRISGIACLWKKLLLPLFYFI